MTFLDAGFLLLGLTLLASMWRMVTGPTNADRAVGADLTYVVFISALALAAVRFDQPMLFDLVLVATLVGFIASIALAHFVDRSPP